MIADGPRECFQCRTTLTFAGGQLTTVDRGEITTCLGCERWIAILERARQLESERAKPDEGEAADVDLSSVAAILARLRGHVAQPFDHAKAAAGDEQ